MGSRTDGGLVDQCMEAPTSTTSDTQYGSQPKDRSMPEVIDSRRSRVVMVPPCRVCGARSSGFHYGVNACEACKTFFRRQLPREASMKCLHEGTCIIRPHRRQNCTACRLKRCKDVGMSREGIKTGRYTLERLTENITEIKQLELKQMMTSRGELITSQDEARKRELDRVISDLSSLYTQGVYKEAASYRVVHKSERQYVEQRQIEEELFGRRAPLHRDEYQAVYTQTGIDVDGRRSITKHILECVNRSCQTIMAFAKALPGFDKLSTNDQKRLLASSTLARWAFLFSSYFNTDLKLMSCPQSQNRILSSDYLSIFISDPDDLGVFWTVIHRIQQLDLTEEENVMAAALATFCTDDMELSSDGYNVVSAAMEYVAEALQHLLMKNHEPEDRTFSKIVMTLVLIRGYGKKSEEIERLFLQDSEGLKLPEIAEYLCKTM